MLFSLKISTKIIFYQKLFFSKYLKFASLTCRGRGYASGRALYATTIYGSMVQGPVFLKGPGSSFSQRSRVRFFPKVQVPVFLKGPGSGFSQRSSPVRVQFFQYAFKIRSFSEYYSIISA